MIVRRHRNQDCKEQVAQQVDPDGHQLQMLIWECVDANPHASYESIVEEYQEPPHVLLLISSGYRELGMQSLLVRDRRHRMFCSQHQQKQQYARPHFAVLVIHIPDLSS
jgi:hypothetical protein